MNVEQPTLQQLRAMTTKKLRAYCELTDWSDDLAVEELNDRDADAQFCEEQFGECHTQELNHCDDWGTGEGRWHGRM